MEFRTMSDLFNCRLNREQRVCGECTVPEFKRGTDAFGDTVLNECGARPLYAAIQEAARGRSPREVVERVARIDASALALSPDQMVDVNATPSTLMDAMNLSLRAKALFDALPTEVKKHYDTNQNKFLKAVDDGSFLKEFGVSLGLVKQPEPAPVPPVTTEGGTNA